MAANAPTDVPVTQLPLSDEQRLWVERAWRDARLIRIGGGTDEVMREVISKTAGVDFSRPGFAP